MKQIILAAGLLFCLFNSTLLAQSGTSSFFVDGVCGMCKTRIETAALQVKGIKKADWDVDKHQLTVDYDTKNYDADRLQQAIAAVGHDTEKYTASDEAYESLHDCCKYRDAEVMAAHAPEVSMGNELPRQLSGYIYVDENGKKQPLPGVNVYWEDQSAVASTNKEGYFELERPAEARRLIASYVGYYTDTLELEKEATISLTLTKGTTLGTVEVTYERKSIEVSFIEPMLVQNIDRKELLKAACCTLAESFETNPAVDVAFTDAVTGARQIEMLGLAGPYMQITRENLPDVRGLASIYGLAYLPGPWLEGLQLAKGTGSVANGFESITGQINVELKKPQEGKRFYFNLYGNQGGRLEANANARFELSDKVSTSVLVHGDVINRENDRNEDDFLDMPTGSAWTAANRWKYSGADGWNAQAGIKVTNFDRNSGQLSSTSESGVPLWEANMLTRRLEGWAKVGKVFLNRPEASIGLQLSGAIHDQEAQFGNQVYDAEQQFTYANLLYQDIIGDNTHRFKTGLSFQWDQYAELLGASTFNRNERVPGAFFEYTYQPGDQFTAVAGLRGDQHNQFGFFLTPRLHLRYAFNESSVLRFSAGTGRRTASIIAENIGMLASSRTILIENTNPDLPYGLNQEIASNIGLSLRQSFTIQNKELVLTLDGFHTRFQQQIVVDYDQSARAVAFYNLDGQSWSSSLQAQLDYALFEGFDIRAAYRFNDVQTDYRQGRLERPFVSRHRAFINLAYETATDWAFDLTVNWQGAKRLPSTADNPVEFQLTDRSPDFTMVNAQVSKQWQDRFDLYLGVENLFDVVQPDPILSADDPFGTYFDSSIIWGPIFGRMVYAGLRYTIE
jgi:copper chaperone CopZ